MLKIYNPTQQKFVCPNKTTMTVQVEDVKFSISCIAILCKEILISLPIGNKRSKIHLVMTSKGEDTWHTFNKCFNALFAEAHWICANITTTTTTPPLGLVILLLCCSSMARLAPFCIVRISITSFKQFIHYHNYSPQKQCMDLATCVLEQTSQIYHPVSFSQSIATLCPPSVIDSITFSASLRGLTCHITGDACTHS